jgi:hypothetical protein
VQINKFQGKIDSAKQYKILKELGMEIEYVKSSDFADKTLDAIDEGMEQAMEKLGELGKKLVTSILVERWRSPTRENVVIAQLTVSLSYPECGNLFEDKRQFVMKSDLPNHPASIIRVIKDDLARTVRRHVQTRQDELSELAADLRKLLDASA